MKLKELFDIKLTEADKPTNWVALFLDLSEEGYMMSNVETNPKTVQSSFHKQTETKGKSTSLEQGIKHLSSHLKRAYDESDGDMDESTRTKSEKDLASAVKKFKSAVEDKKGMFKIVHSGHNGWNCALVFQGDEKLDEGKRTKKIEDLEKEGFPVFHQETEVVIIITDIKPTYPVKKWYDMLNSSLPKDVLEVMSDQVDEGTPLRHKDIFDPTFDYTGMTIKRMMRRGYLDYMEKLWTP